MKFHTPVADLKRLQKCLPFSLPDFPCWTYSLCCPVCPTNHTSNSTRTRETPHSIFPWLLLAGSSGSTASLCISLALHKEQKPIGVFSQGASLPHGNLLKQIFHQYRNSCLWRYQRIKRKKENTERRITIFSRERENSFLGRDRRNSYILWWDLTVQKRNTKGNKNQTWINAKRSMFVKWSPKENLNFLCIFKSACFVVLCENAVFAKVKNMYKKLREGHKVRDNLSLFTEIIWLKL